MGAGNRSAIGTLVERTTRYLILLAFLDGVATTDAVRHAITAALAGPCRAEADADLGSGQGARPPSAHHRPDRHRRVFRDAHSPWQRGSNENMNGLLRDYFPKGTDLSIHTIQDIERIATEVNDRPRKTLGWQRPAELFADAATAA